MYLDKFALKESFKEKIFNKLFDNCELEDKLDDLYEEWEDEHHLYDIGQITDEYCKLITRRLEHLYVGIINDDIYLQIKSKKEKILSRTQNPRKIYRFEYLLLLWQLQNTNVKEIRTRRQKDENLDLLLSKM